VTDGRGRPLAATVTAEQANESPAFAPLLESVRLPGYPRARRPARVAGDKGYRRPRVLRWLRHRRIAAVIPTSRDTDALGRRDRRFDAAAYRRRNVVERCVGRLKEFKRVATRSERLAVNYRAMVHVAMLVLWLRDDSRDRA